MKNYKKDFKEALLTRRQRLLYCSIIQKGEWTTQIMFGIMTPINGSKEINA